jgi:selenophosphate synthetase-related protein
MPGPPDRSDLAEVVTRFQQNPGLRAKAGLELVSVALGPTDWVHGPGDDAAVVLRDADGSILAAGEAILPSFLEADPRSAGVAAVVANVNDIAAMGGRPVALVDTIVGPEAVAREALEGMRWAADRYRVQIVGGHLTLLDGPPSLSAFVVGRATNLLAASNARPGHILLHAACTEGEPNPGFPFFSSLRPREDRLADDIEALAEIADRGLAQAAKDVSLAGLLGSIAMLLEPTRSGVTVDLDHVPRPPEVALPRWTEVFPSYGFLLCADPGDVEACTGVFTRRGLACEAIGVLNDTGALGVRLAGEEAVLVDLRRTSVTGLAGAG